MMTKEIKHLRYNFSEQKEEYPKISKRLSQKEKENLLNKLFEDDLWSYFQLIVEILYDLSSDGEEYINLLEKVYSEIKYDMASFTFFQMLIKLGREHRQGIKIYEKIMSNENEEFSIISGLILGGYSIKNNEKLEESIKNKELSYPKTNVLLKAILVKGEEVKNITSQEYSFLNRVLKSDNEKILMELMNTCIFLYKINKGYFLEMIKNLMNKKKSRINGKVWIMKEKMGLSNQEIFELAELTKDCDEYAIGEIIKSLVLNKTKYSKEEIEKIAELLISWINNDLEFKVRDIDWALEEFGKKYPEILDYFLEHYDSLKIKDKKIGYNYLFPRIFEKLIKRNVKESITKLIEKNILEKDSKLFFKLATKIIGEIYSITSKKKGFNIFSNIAKLIQEFAKNEEFINDNEKSFNEMIKNENFDELIYYINNLLEQLIFRAKDFDFDKIYKNLSKFKKINKTIIPELKKVERLKKYSPFFWLGDWQRDKELKKSYLEEIEKFLENSKELQNQKTRDNSWSLLSSLTDEDNFWNHFSEIIFSNKFIPNYESIIEPEIPNTEKNADLSIKLNDKKMFFEITKPKTNRNLHLDNGAVGVKNKLNKAIHVKTNQFRSEKTISEIKEGKRDDLFLIVTDISSSTIDEYMVEESFYGSLAIQFYRNNKTGETTPSRTIRQNNAVIKNKEFISGLIYFNPQLVNVGGEIKFKLIGDIIPNQEALNKITPEDYKKLKKIIFS